MSTVTIGFPVAKAPPVNFAAFAACLNKRLPIDMSVDPNDCTVTLIFAEDNVFWTFRFNMPMIDQLLDNAKLQEGAPDVVSLVAEGRAFIARHGVQIVLDESDEDAPRIVGLA